ncbi:hypothetical protein [Paenibacillus aceris]|uniref:Uncharacterized protein n=1 Tax=Paenibacillus aceris TaxID=869555 RepID=A0ABS4HQD8_9BACL|nr:hypothetical protein [Paenibacillus aceris]MBP1960822.1 hypothetical protein [Paenibacillus aceris]
MIVNPEQKEKVHNREYIPDKSKYSPRFSESNSDLATTLLHLGQEGDKFTKKSYQPFELLYYSVGAVTKFKISLKDIFRELKYWSLSIEQFYSTNAHQSFTESIKHYLDKRVELKNRRLGECLAPWAKLAEKVHDKTILMLIRKFLQSGVMEDGLVKPTKEGVPQGGPSKSRKLRQANQSAGEGRLPSTKHKVTKGYLRDTYIGYVLSGPLPQKVVNAIHHSIAIIENGDLSDVRTFITAAVITGYVFNEMPFLIKDMRPLDDYDILRFWLMLLTINHYGINMKSINTVRSDRKNHITFCNVDLYLPAVNDLSLNTDEVKMLMHKTPLSPRPAVLLELVDD